MNSWLFVCNSLGNADNKESLFFSSMALAWKKIYRNF